MMHQFMSIKELSLYLNVKEKTLYAKVSAKEIPHYKIARLVRFKKEEIDHWIEEKKVDPIHIDREVNQIIRNIKKKNAEIDIKSVVKNVIEETKIKSL